MGDKMTKPESQNTGIPVTYPVRLMVRTERALPTTPRIVFAMTRAAPVFSKMVPMMVPATMTMPMLDKIPPNPLLTVAMTLSAGMPQTSPTKMETKIITTKGCCLYLLMATIIMMTARMITAPMNKPDITNPPPND